MKNYFSKLLIVFTVVLSALYGGCVFASTTQGTIDSTYKYAWGENTGFISFSTTGGGSVIVTDSDLTGYAWSKIYGWIKMNPENYGVKNNAEGTLSGSAWGENTGWINFSGVTIDATGRFKGKATGDIVGEINFDCDECKVITDWRHAGLRGGGNLPSGAYVPPEATSLSVSVNNGAVKTNNANVAITLKAGLEVKSMMISNSADFTNAVEETFANTKSWTLSAGDGQKTVYFKFFSQYGQASNVISSSIALDTTAPELKITQSQESYNSTDTIMLAGATEADSKVDLFIDNSSYTAFSSDNLGNWLINLGKYSVGSHHLEFTPTDSIGNVGKPTALDFSVKQAEIPTEVQATPPSNIITETITNTFAPLLNTVKDQLNTFLPGIIKPEEVTPAQVVVISTTTPDALTNKWALLAQKEIGSFVLSPLPSEIALIAQKFPEVQQTLSEVGVTTVADVSKLQGTTFKLPGITQTLAFSQVELRTGQLTPAKGIPIAQLTSISKSKIPSEIMFAKTGAGLIDFNTAVSINDKGNTEQRISTLTGNTVQFIVRVDGPANSVKGYLTFKSKKPEALSSSIPLNKLTASLLFSEPDLAKTQEQPIESATPEQILVVKQFDYKDSGDGVYTADVSMPVVSGEYGVITVVDYKDKTLGTKEMNLITVVDPEGYVYEKDGDKETRIAGAIVSLYWLNPDTKQYELWPAKNYQQENSQITDVTGNYSFLVPDGYYYLKIDAPGYLSYDGKPFEVTEGSGVHINIELKTKYWWLKIIDWKTVLLVVAVLLLIYNFYKDKVRDLILLKKNNH